MARPHPSLPLPTPLTAPAQADLNSITAPGIEAKGDDEAILLLRRLLQARARGLDKHIGPIRAAAEDGDWRAAAWLIVKLYPSMRDGAPVEEIHLPDPAGEDQVKAQLSTPDRVAGLLRIAAETGLLRAPQS